MTRRARRILLLKRHAAQTDNNADWMIFENSVRFNSCSPFVWFLHSHSLVCLSRHGSIRAALLLVRLIPISKFVRVFYCLSVNTGSMWLLILVFFFFLVGESSRRLSRLFCIWSRPLKFAFMRQIQLRRRWTKVLRSGVHGHWSAFLLLLYIVRHLCVCSIQISSFFFFLLS